MALHGLLTLPISQVVISAACTCPPVTVGQPSRAHFVYSSPSANRKLILSSCSNNNPYTVAGAMEVAAGEEEHELKLLGTWRGPFALRVRLALNFKGLSYEYQEEDLANKSKLLLESNPVNKKVPVLIHNGVPICESLAILEYVDEVYRGIGPCLLPADPYQRARARFWAAYIDNKLVAPWWKMFVGKTNKEKDEGRKQTLAAVEMLEGALGECSKGKTFFGGDNVGYIDVVLGGMVAWMLGTKALCGVELLHATKTPLLLGWMESFGGLEPAKVVLPEVDRLVEFAKMKRAQRTLI
ncbi:probable glutathione S-transferase GSTU6 isoform X2 [Hordeum vulgare subsp. vulgare]|uniref:probable glutathione S-transferase GSTU6 isoform X2 n=1 Tax=Hordeum vulgare subsp. vulgare TaxID=112509 RepID=UPI000294D625|nr:probable glutathione S-transferase GSTU6 isoform X2 [Hordeum vulgare subsp. vulgare]